MGQQDACIIPPSLLAGLLSRPRAAGLANPGIEFSCKVALVFVVTLCSPVWAQQPQAVILTPGAAVTNGPMVVSGYAYDLRATADSGIREVQVWAYPNAQPGGIFLDSATLGFDRTVPPSVMALSTR